MLEEQRKSLLEVLEQDNTVLANRSSRAGMPLSVITGDRTNQPGYPGTPPSPYVTITTGDRRTARDRWFDLIRTFNPATSTATPSWQNGGHVLPDADATPRVLPLSASRGQTASPIGGGVLLHQLSGMHFLRDGVAVGPDSDVMPISPARSDESEALRNLPFKQRSVRPSDGNPVQRLCFMRGAGGESAAVQLMVVLSRQVGW
jgi:hypothetical protein